MQIIKYSPTDQQKINQFVLENEGHLLQSFYWGEFQVNEGRKVINLGVEDKNEMLLSAQIIIHQLPLGKCYLYLPRGPVFKHTNYDNINRNVFAILLSELKKIGVKEQAIFIKIEPEVRTSEDQYKMYRDAGFIISAKHIQPTDTLILDIGSDEESLLKNMHHKTRYNIRLAVRRGVKIINGISDKNIKNFYHLMEQTARRDNFKAHTYKYYRDQLETLAKNKLINLYLAEINQKVVAGIIVTYWGRRATYLHGAMDGKYRKFMAPHLLQWEAIKDAKKFGCTQYDMWGIAPEDALADHPWNGITRFKQGFGGENIYLAGSLDLILQKFWYRLYNLAAGK